MIEVMLLAVVFFVGLGAVAGAVIIVGLRLLGGKKAPDTPPV